MTVPDSINGCVMGATPSIELGTLTPCQWTSVPMGSSLWTTIWTRSPTSTLIWGPGTIPLYDQASTMTPGSTSQGVTAAVSSNFLVPSSRTSGSSG